MGPPWPLSWPRVGFLVVLHLADFFILALYRKPVGQMTVELQA